MIIDIKVPSPGESVTEVQLASWLVKSGDIVEKDDEIAEVDSDKATLSINAPEKGMILLKVQEGETIGVGTVIASIDTSSSKGKNKESKDNGETQVDTREEVTKMDSPNIVHEIGSENKVPISPLAKKMMEEKNISESEVLNITGGRRVSKADIESIQVASESKKSDVIEPVPDVKHKDNLVTSGERIVERKKLTTLRLKISERLVSVKNETAMLTTFNEVNMSNIMSLRKKYNDKFKEKHGVSVGFMSLFTKAVSIALQEFPQVNSIMDEEELIFHNYVDVGIAVSSPKGLVVPVIRNAEKMSIADLEIEIKQLAEKARNNKISLEEMTGGTFTISNGGVFGSMLSTPILNPPQSAILGMHNIIERPIAQNGQVVIAPMMYVALSYDHRVIDGRESVSFLVKVKELLESPEVMFYNGKDPIKALLQI